MAASQDRAPAPPGPSGSEPDLKQEARELAGQQAMIDALAPQVAVLDGEGEIIMTNAAWKRFGSENGETRPWRSHNYIAVCEAAKDDPPAAEIAESLRAMLAGNLEHFMAEYPCHSPTEKRWFQASATRYDGPGGARLLVAHTTVTERENAQRKIATQSAILDEIDVAIVGTNLAGKMTHWNKCAERMYGWTRAEALGRDTAELALTDDPATLAAAAAALQHTGRWEGEFKGRRKNGEEFPVFTRTKLIAPRPGADAAILAISVDVSERVESERALQEAHSHLKAVMNSMDEGLATLDFDGRLTFMNQAAEELLGFSEAELHGKVFHDFTHNRRPDGSPLAIEDCPIRHARRDGETVRIADDIFIRHDGSALAVSYTASPFATAEGVEGCAVVFRDISEMKRREEKLRREAAMLTRIDAITAALAEERLVLYSQPIVDVRTGRAVQRELLIRMREPDGTIAGPDTFLPIAEEYGLIGEIDRWVIARGIELARSGDPVELNVSACSIGDELVLDHIRACLARTGTDPALIVFELTETAIVADEERARQFADGLHELGCKLALDDFGTGYGTFTYLKQLPVDYLKIDVEFVRDIADNESSRHLVEAVVGIARSFGLETVGEGVEDGRTLEILAELGIDFAQGYYLGRPGALEDTPAVVPAREVPPPPAPARQHPRGAHEARSGDPLRIAR